MAAAAASQLRSRVKVMAFDKSKTQEVVQEIFGKLGLKEQNSGVFNGTWGGKGPIVESVDPSTNVTIAKIQTVIDELFQRFDCCRERLKS